MLGQTLLRRVSEGAIAGAAATTALEAATYLDMAVRGRPASTTPQESVERAATLFGLTVPGAGETRANRVSGIGSLGGIAVGVGLGGVLGVLRGLGWRPGPVRGPLLAAGLAMVVANAPMTGLRVTDPRAWSAQDWAADVLPHLAYGLVAHATLAALE